MTTAAKRPVLLIVTIAVAIEVFMVATDMGPDVLLVAAAVALVGVGAWILVDTAEATPSVSVIGTAARPQPEHRVDRRVTRLRSGLAHGQTDRLSAERLHASLVEIIDDQLSTAHRIDRRTEPAAAAALMGPELTGFVEDHATQISLPNTRELDRLLTRIERL